MSTAQPVALPPAEAHNALHHRIYAPVLFTKLAKDFGIRPRNADEQARLLKMAVQLRTGHDRTEMTKSAGQGDFLAEAEAHLERQLHSIGVPVETANDAIVKQAAAELALDPDIAHAMISMQFAGAGEAD